MRNYITIATSVVFIIVYEVIVIFVFNWTGIYRTIGAVLVGIVGTAVGKFIAEKIENSKK